jgi:acetyl esterase/lipase
MSARLTILNAALRGIGRPLLKRTKTPERARRDFDLAARLVFLGPRRTARRAEIGGVPCLDVRPGGAEGKGVLLYLHGGGYITGSARTHLPMVGHLAGRIGCRAVLADYRLAPEDPFPAMFDDALAVWNGLRKEGVSAGRILLGGDSAGGGLALALLAHVLGDGERPAGLFAFSPWTDLTLSGASLEENAESDVILPVERIRELQGLLAPEDSLADPRLSPLFAQFAGAPPVYLQASETEILRDDTLRIEARLREAGVEVQTDLWPDAPHVWQVFRGWLAEADDALERVADFARRCLRSSSPQSGS